MIFVSVSVCAVGTLFLGAFLPPVFLQGIGLVIASLVWAYFGRKPRVFVALSLLVTIIPYAILGWSAWSHVAHLQEKYAYVSMEDRLRVRAPEKVELSAAASERLAAFEDTVDRHDLFRDRKLEELHEHTLGVFVNQPGFGVARMSGMREEWLARGLRDDPPVPQPGARTAFIWSSDVLDQGSRKADIPEAMHRGGVVDFVNPNGFGYMKDRRRVAGFQEHQFSKVPESGQSWNLATLDLVGLVVHDEATVYVSEHLPRMDELRSAPTRPPDEFEEMGLTKLRQGEDFFIRESKQVRRMLGSVRSAQQCMSCHDGPRGTLLGAFSYTFTKR
jgi:hypothetical protein